MSISRRARGDGVARLLDLDVERGLAGREAGRDRGDGDAGALAAPRAATRDQRRVDADGGDRRDLGPRRVGADGLRAQVADLARRVGALERRQVDHRRRDAGCPGAWPSVLIERRPSAAARSSTPTRLTGISERLMPSSLVLEPQQMRAPTVERHVQPLARPLVARAAQEVRAGPRRDVHEALRGRVAEVDDHEVAVEATRRRGSGTSRCRASRCTRTGASRRSQAESATRAAAARRTRAGRRRRGSSGPRAEEHRDVRAVPVELAVVVEPRARQRRHHDRRRARLRGPERGRPRAARRGSR